MKKSILFVISLFVLGGITVKSQVSTSPDVPKAVKSDAEDFINYYGYNEDYSRFFIRTGPSFDYGLCYYDPCDYYDEEQGVGYDYLTTVHYDPATGLDYDLYGGYHLNRFISVGIGFEYFHGFNVKQTRTGGSGGSEGTSFAEDVKWRASMLGIIPGIEITPGFTPLNPWLDIGAYIGVMPRIMEKSSQTTSSATSSTVVAETGYFHGGIPVGFNIKAGVDWNISKTIGLYADLNFLGLNWTPAHYSMKTHSTNGVDDLASLSTYYKEIDYKKTIDRSLTPSYDSHNQQLRQTDPFTAIGLDVGVKFNLGKWERW
jgi:hypothetical protein